MSHLRWLIVHSAAATICRVGSIFAVCKFVALYCVQALGLNPLWPSC